MNKTLIILFLVLVPLLTSAALLTHLKVEGVTQPVISLNGTWLIGDNRQPIHVPGEIAMQGISIKHDEPICYYKEIVIPKNYKNQNVILRFDGVYSYAKLWVNGKFVREHHGGFTRWEADITNFVSVGKKAEIKLEVTDRFDEISYAAGYAKHIIGGILRDVFLYALPKKHLDYFFVETDLDKDYRDATLKLKVKSKLSNPLDLKVKLLDKQGRSIWKEIKNFTVSSDKDENIFIISVSNPQKWTAEHPNLYNLMVEVYEKGKKSYSFIQKIGFRKIEIKKNVFKVNGRPVKLRGACWHNIHPTLGRVSTLDYELKDIQLAKKANINFFRTSHYAPSERFVELCDEHGIYIEAESAVAFVNINRPSLYGLGKTENDSAYIGRYLGQLKEMVQTLRNSPSVLFWSIGNENRYGTNFQLSYDWVKDADTTRPVIFSFPATVPKGKKVTDLLSGHYPSYTGDILNQHGLIIRNFKSPDMPVVFDEMAHVACYANNTLRTDPNIRVFWGESLDKMWTNMFEVPEVMGGAIWCMLDETFMMPSSLEGFGKWWGVAYPKEHAPDEYRGPVVGYGEWGLIDVWRREKPEFWATKKAFSPVKLLQTTIMDFVPGAPLLIPVHNRFDHTDLSEVELHYIYKGKKFIKACLFLEPHKKGLILLDAADWENGDVIHMEFYRNNELIDTYVIKLGNEVFVEKKTSVSHDDLHVIEDNDFLLVSSSDFRIPFNVKNGLIEGATWGKDTLIISGPYFNLDASKKKISCTDWRFGTMKYEQRRKCVFVYVSGLCKDIPVEYIFRIEADGSMDIICSSLKNPAEYIREEGLVFQLSPIMERLKWERKGYFSYYPENDLGALSGNVPVYAICSLIYREEPLHSWGEDDTNFYYWGLKSRQTEKAQRLTNLTKSMKENIYNYSLVSHSAEFRVISKNATVACRINQEEDNKLYLYINKLWDYPEIGWGNYYKNISQDSFHQIFRFSLKKRTDIKE